MGETKDFWLAVERLVTNQRTVIDRPKGSAHPTLPDFIYPLDYGYLEGSRTTDGGGVDIWRGSETEARVSALFVSVDEYKKDVELKIAVGTTPEENNLILECMNQGSMHAIPILNRMDALECLYTRRSIRRFQDRPVEAERLKQVLQAAVWAPSAHNKQPWRFVVLESELSRQRLVAAMEKLFREDLQKDGVPKDEIETRLERSRQRILGAPAALILLLAQEDLPENLSPARREKEMSMAVQSVALAGGQILLAAHALGLGGLWMCAPLFAQKAVQQSLGLPESWLAQALILLGYAVEQPTAPERKPLTEVTRFV